MWFFYVFKFNIVFFLYRVNNIYRKYRTCFSNFFQSHTNCVGLPFLKFWKNTSNFPSKISKSILTLYMLTPQNGQRHSNIWHPTILIFSNKKSTWYTIATTIYWWNIENDWFYTIIFETRWLLTSKDWS